MKAIILVGGYATRLFPITKEFPKHLLQIGEKPLLTHLVEEINNIEEINEIILVSNSKYYTYFVEWANDLNMDKIINVLDDGSERLEDRKGPVAGIIYAIKQRKINEDILIIAGDSLLDFKLDKFNEYFKRVKASCLCAKVVDNKEEIKRYGVIEIDNKYKVINFEEKPQVPKSNIASFMVYILQKDDLHLFKEFMKNIIEYNNNMNGEENKRKNNFLEYFVQKTTIYAYMFKGELYDVGNHKDLNYVRSIYNNEKR